MPFIVKSHGVPKKPFKYEKYFGLFFHHYFMIFLICIPKYKNLVFRITFNREENDDQRKTENTDTEIKTKEKEA